jgi:hypothetical protein
MSLIRLPKAAPSLLSKLKAQLVQDVPRGDALCEFDCRKRQCKMGEWQTCERRLRYLQDCSSPKQPEN